MITCGPAERNKAHIFKILKENILRFQLPEDSKKKDKLASIEASMKMVNIVEVACGTGTHAAYFSAQLPYVRYHPTEPGVHCKGSRAGGAFCA